MNKENVVEKWKSCQHSLSFSISPREVVEKLRGEGILENYGCDNPNIVDSGAYETNEVLDYSHSPVTLNSVALFHRTGKVTDQSVIDVLNKACGNCPFYQKEED